MTYDELTDMWNEDGQVGFDYEKGIKDIPKLHAKYLKMYLEERKKLILYEGKFKALKKEKREFFTNPPGLKHEKGWELPPQGAIIKSEINNFLEGDEDIIKEQIKIALQESLVEGITKILRQIETRTFLFKDLMEDRKFKAGL